MLVYVKLLLVDRSCRRSDRRIVLTGVRCDAQVGMWEVTRLHGKCVQMTP